MLKAVSTRDPPSMSSGSRFASSKPQLKPYSVGFILFVHYITSSYHSVVALYFTFIINPFVIAMAALTRYTRFNDLYHSDRVSDITLRFSNVD